MKLLRRFFGKDELWIEKREQNDSWAYLSAYSGTGSQVNARLAESLSVVYACVAAISSSIASLPALIYRWEGQSRIEAEDHPLAGLIAYGPNQHQSWPDFIEWLLASVLLRGNGLAEIVTDSAGRLSELRPIPWEWCSVVLLPNGRLAYDVTEQTFLGGQGRTRRLLQGEVFHLRDRSDDGLVGRSRLSRTAETFQNSLDIHQTHGAVMRNGLNPSGAFSTDAGLSPEQMSAMRQQITNGFAGPTKAGKFLILSNGLTFQPVAISPEDAELLDGLRFTTEELARVFQVPPPIVGMYENNTFTNAETAGRWFAMHTLRPWVRKIEAEFKRTIFTAYERQDYFLEIDMGGFMRGDPEQRWRAYDIALKNKVLTSNEVRQEEGWNPLSTTTEEQAPAVA